MIAEKLCSKCKRLLPADRFFKDSRSPSGLTCQCKSCIKSYRSSHKDQIAESKKRYSAAHKDKISEKNRKYRENNKEKIAEYHKNYYTEHREEMNKKTKENYIKNKAIYRKKNLEAKKRRLLSDPVYAEKERVRAALRICLRRGGGGADCKTAVMVGCSLDDLVMHLKQSYKDNYGKEWDETQVVEIDHIIPLCTAKTKDEVIKLCHWTNLQLLTPSDNQRKGKKIIKGRTT